MELIDAIKTWCKSVGPKSDSECPKCGSEKHISRWTSLLGNTLYSCMKCGYDW